MVLASVDEGWSYGGSILTFLLPMLAFAAVALALLVLYTKPQMIPGRRPPGAEVSVGATRMPGLAAPSGKHAEGRADGTQANGQAASSEAPASAE